MTTRLYSISICLLTACEMHSEAKLLNDCMKLLRSLGTGHVCMLTAIWDMSQY